MSIRSLARRLLGVTRTSTYYLPWLTLAGLDCTLIVNNVETRFQAGQPRGPLPLPVTQFDADGELVRRFDVTLKDCHDVVEVRLQPTAHGYGFAALDGDRVQSDLYVTLSDGTTYTATHGRGEFLETYPLPARLFWAALGPLLALTGRTVPAFQRDQYVYVGANSRSHLLLLNLSNITNRIRLALNHDGAPLNTRLVSLRPRGALLLDIAALAPPGAASLQAWRLHLEGNAWFNLYVVGAGPRDLAGPLSLMHVK